MKQLQSIKEEDGGCQKKQNQPILPSQNIYYCGVQNCQMEFKGRTQNSVVQKEFLPHMKTFHNDKYCEQTESQTLINQIIKIYLKRKALKNYYCKICGPYSQKYTQLENNKLRNGLIAHLQQAHSDMFDQNDQDWVEKFIGYDQVSFGNGSGRPTLKLIPGKYPNQYFEEQTSNTIYQISEDEVNDLKILGIDYERNARYDNIQIVYLQEVAENSAKIEELMENTGKQYIKTMEIPTDYSRLLGQQLNSSSIQKLQDFCDLIRGTKELSKHQIAYMSELIKVSLISIANGQLNPNQEIMLQENHFMKDVMIKYIKQLQEDQKEIKNKNSQSLSNNMGQAMNDEEQENKGAQNTVLQNQAMVKQEDNFNDQYIINNNFNGVKQCEPNTYHKQTHDSNQLYSEQQRYQQNKLLKLENMEVKQEHMNHQQQQQQQQQYTSTGVLKIQQQQQQQQKQSYMQNQNDMNTFYKGSYDDEDDDIFTMPYNLNYNQVRGNNTQFQQQQLQGQAVLDHSQKQQLQKQGNNQNINYVNNPQKQQQPYNVQYNANNNIEYQPNNNPLQGLNHTQIQQMQLGSNPNNYNKPNFQ